MKMMTRMMKLVIYGSAHKNEDSLLHSVASHIISLQMYLRVPGTTTPSLPSLILYGLFHLEDNFIFQQGLFGIQLLFCWFGGFFFYPQGQ